MWAANINQFTQRIHDYTGLYDNCWGFLDGTVRAMCRPLYAQQLGYSGHKKVHGLKFQNVTLPNGLVGCHWGPELARRHDAWVLATSGAIEQFNQLCTVVGRRVCVYADTAYPLLPTVQCGFRGQNLTAQQNNFNQTMSCARVSVEWGFAQIISNFAWLDFKKTQKVWSTPIALYYSIAVLFTNCITCARGGNEISELFSCPPPTIQHYLSMAPHE